MLTENDVVNHLTRHLQSEGYEILQSLTTNQKGVDVIAKLGERTEYVEAKGETSSVQTSNRFGKAFNKNQVKSHVSRALLASMKILNEKPAGAGTVAAIALPNTRGHKELIDEIFVPLDKLDILVYWIDGKGSVTTNRIERIK